MLAKPGRQQTIIKDQKRPDDFKASRYRLAYDAITNYIVQPNCFSLQNAVCSMTTLESDSDWTKQNAELCQAALIRFMAIAENISWNGLMPAPGDNTAPKMHLSGVDISVRPEILLQNGRDIVGAIKLYINKGIPLTGDSGNYVSTILYRYLSTILSNEAIVDRKKCIVIDVFGQNIFYAPSAYKRTMHDVDAACKTISVLWDVL